MPEKDVISTDGLIRLKNGVLAQCPLATEIHHMRGRVGKLLIDPTFFMAVSSGGHDYIHQHPKIAYEKGYMMPR